MQITFREITPTDASALARLSLQFGYTVSDEEMRQRLVQVVPREDHCGFVALDGQQVVGWIHGFHALRLESEAFVEIGGLVVDTHFRKQGIGLQLVSKVRAWALARSVTKLRVRCNSLRTDTHSFYLRIGFIERKEQKVFDSYIA